MKIKRITGLSLVALSLALASSTLSVHAKDKKENANIGPELTDYFTIIDENGNSKIIHFDDIDSDDSKIEESTKEYNIVAGKGDDKEVVATYETKDKAQQALAKKQAYRSSTTYALEESTRDISYGVVYLKSESPITGNSYLTYDNVSNPGYDGYTTGSYAKDAAYLGTVNGKVRAMQAGIVMDFHPEDVTVVDYNHANISY